MVSSTTRRFVSLSLSFSLSFCIFLNILDILYLFSFSFSKSVSSVLTFPLKSIKFTQHGLFRQLYSSLSYTWMQFIRCNFLLSKFRFRIETFYDQDFVFVFVFRWSFFPRIFQLQRLSSSPRRDFSRTFFGTILYRFFFFHRIEISIGLWRLLFLNILTLHLPCMPSNVVVLDGVLRSDGNLLLKEFDWLIGVFIFAETGKLPETIGGSICQRGQRQESHVRSKLLKTELQTKMVLPKGRKSFVLLRLFVYIYIILFIYFFINNNMKKYN